MLTFIGEYECKADNKYRIVVPSSFRKVMTGELQNTFVLRKNLYEDCIDMFPLKQWEIMIGDLKKRLNLLDRNHAQFFRGFNAGAREVEMDGNGRILLPRKLLEEVYIDREMILSGQDAKIEIWQPERYNEIGLNQSQLEELARNIFKTDDKND